jgi:hypothetical protein
VNIKRLYAEDDLKESYFLAAGSNPIWGAACPKVVGSNPPTLSRKIQALG